MTDRITHEEALRALNVPWDTTRLRAYITQQQAAEANTVSRAEHEAVLDRVLGQRESEHDSRITALQAEHEAERARMGELIAQGHSDLVNSNARVAELEADNRALALEVERLRREATDQRRESRQAEARVVELEAELRIAWEDEPASPSPAVEAARRPECPHGVGLCTSSCPSKAPAVEDWSKVEQGPFSGPEYSLASKPAPSIEAGRFQTSPFRQVAEASVQPAPGGKHCLNEDAWCVWCKRFDPRGACPGPADPPKPGGLERCAEPTFSVVNEALPGELPSSRYSAETIAYANACNLLRVTTDGLGFIRGVKPDYPEPDPAPADQPAPAYWREDEDSSLDLHIRQREASRPDYVTRGELEKLATDVAEALRATGRGERPVPALTLAGDALEKARKP